MQFTTTLAALLFAVPAVMGAAMPQRPPIVGPGHPVHPPHPGPPPHHGPKKCMQEWFGTAPFCNGKCPAGWDVVKYEERAGACERDHPFKIIISCNNLSSHKCATGSKALCERCW